MEESADSSSGIIQGNPLETISWHDPTWWEKRCLLESKSFGSYTIDANGVLFAVKEVSLLDQSYQGKQRIDQLKWEITLLSQFEHENIVQYYGTYKDKDERKLYILLELGTHGSLLELYQKFCLQDSQVSAYTRHILHGLKYLHDRNVVHRDIKCANILVHANGRVKLANFGLAKAIESNDHVTLPSMAPEVLIGKSQGSPGSADIWSLGCTVLEMFTRKRPYSDLEKSVAMFKIGRGIPPTVPDYLSQDARDFILKCLQPEASDRPTAAQLLDHPFVKKQILTASSFTSPTVAR